MNKNLKKYLIFTAGIFFILVGCKSQNKKSDNEPYNVLFLIVDDMNDYGFYKNIPVDVKMPYLDKFKKSAVTFRNAYCSAPVCTPSRAATFSGLHAYSTGAYFNGSNPFQESQQLLAAETLPELFKKSGYETFGHGKLFHSKLPEGRMKDNFDNQPWGGGFGPFPDEDHQIKGRFWGLQTFPDSVFPDVRNSNAMIEFLSLEHEKPFFMAFGLWRPHTPFTSPRRFFDMYDIDNIPLPPGYKSSDLKDIGQEAKKLLDPFGRFNPDNEKEWRELIRGYLAGTSFADWSVGRVIEALDNSTYADNTIVVFWSDNGYHCGEKNHWEKNTLWEKSALTPMAIRIPGSESNGKVSNTPVSLVDIYPTLVDYCKLKGPKQKLDGKSLRAILENPEVVVKRTAVTTFGEGFASVRSERFRYIVYNDGSEELYDLENDPYEWFNLASKDEFLEIKNCLKKKVPDDYVKALPGRRS